MNQHNFVLVNCDTDSIMICEQDGSFITKERRSELLNELNSLLPARIKFEDDGYYPSVLITKAKNYVLVDEQGKKKIKGSALKASMKEVGCKDFIKEVIDTLMTQGVEGIMDVYHKYCEEIYSLKDISRWCSKKTITDKVLNPERTNERKILDALQGTEFSQGDKIYTYFDVNGNVKLQQNWTGDHNPELLVEKLWKTLAVFSTVLDIKQFPKYHLKRNKHLLSRFNNL